MEKELGKSVMLSIGAKPIIEDGKVKDFIGGGFVEMQITDPYVGKVDTEYSKQKAFQWRRGNNAMPRLSLSTAKRKRKRRTSKNSRKRNRRK